MRWTIRDIDDPRSFRLRKFIASWWETVTGFGPHAHAHWPAVRVSLCMTASLGAALALGHPDWTGYAGFGAVCAVYGKQTDYDERLRAQLESGALLVLAVVGGTVVSLLPGRVWWALAATGLISALGSLAHHARGLRPVPSLFLAFALGTMAAVPHTTADLPQALLVSVAAVAGCAVVGQLGRVLPSSRRPRTPAPARRSAAEALADPAARSDVLLHLAAPPLAGLAAMALGSAHPSWAAVAATAPLAIPDGLGARAGRATLRAGGTVIGAVLAYAILAPAPPTWTLLVAVALLQAWIELFVARNYGIAVLAITPIALVMSALAAPSPAGPLVVDRVAATTTGAAVAVLVLVAAAALRRTRSQGLVAAVPSAPAAEPLPA